ncbi:DUF883 domain-containing protein [Cupriavidus necator]|uniref:DUF883 domain-containing protein n=2 Tax=Cupriavidus necator TaxID=106590 RepID=Q0K9N1_CUPNH|nr:MULTISPECIES: DUF883 family protein [Cupriavidus]EON20210.1 hypothetical protein C265_08332 [Cupriavidus sp. GA3-3]KUE87025.1 hypothetical protein ASL20_20015 [Cupriavidus necator]QCC01100.1 DUF883 domain-containing protein [Cupriavidus necator H16]QQB76076.1 DUF883 family protein [Cupriavidus necator]QQX83000.1 DUF883 family protein [Cupriavidus necator]
MNDIQSDFSMRKDALARDVDTLMADVQALLHDVKAETGVGTSLERHALKARQRALQERIVTLREESRAKVSEWATTTDRYVHEHPWQSMGTVAAIAATTGAIVALAASHR